MEGVQVCHLLINKWNKNRQTEMTHGQQQTPVWNHLCNKISVKLGVDLENVNRGQTKLAIYI